MSEITRIAILGDLHGYWDDVDARYFNSAKYDLLLFTGDLGSGTANNGVRVARSIGRLEKPALVMAGNNDAHETSQIAAELGHQRGLFALLKLGGRSSAAASGQVHMAGYSLHSYVFAGRATTVLAARPYAKGGSELSFPEQLRASYGVETIADSARKLCELVDRAETSELIILAHNGPSGLGAGATDLWGRDFAPEQGDWGDSDLREAISHARKRDKRVLAVVAGHMHSPTRTAETRTWQQRRDETLYINAARVPRIFEQADGQYRHHLVLEIEDGKATARELLTREPD